MVAGPGASGPGGLRASGSSVQLLSGLLRRRSSPPMGSLPLASMNLPELSSMLASPSPATGPSPGLGPAGSMQRPGSPPFLLPPSMMRTTMPGDEVGALLPPLQPLASSGLSHMLSMRRSMSMREPWEEPVVGSLGAQGLADFMPMSPPQPPLAQPPRAMGALNNNNSNANSSLAANASTTPSPPSFSSMLPSSPLFAAPISFMLQSPLGRRGTNPMGGALLGSLGSPGAAGGMGFEDGGPSTLEGMGSPGSLLGFLGSNNSLGAGLGPNDMDMLGSPGFGVGRAGGPALGLGSLLGDAGQPLTLGTTPGAAAAKGSSVRQVEVAPRAPLSMKEGKDVVDGPSSQGLWGGFSSNTNSAELWPQPMSLESLFSGALASPKPGQAGSGSGLNTGLGSLGNMLLGSPGTPLRDAPSMGHGVGSYLLQEPLAPKMQEGGVDARKGPYTQDGQDLSNATPLPDLRIDTSTNPATSEFRLMHHAHSA